MRVFSHLGFRPRTGHLRVGRRGRTAAGNNQPGAIHALNSTKDRGVLESLCGVRVEAAEYDLDDNVWQADEESRPTCKQCLLILEERCQVAK